MTIDLLVNQGWAYHDTDSERLANELEAADVENLDESVLASTLNLANHTIGEHLRDWPRALTFVVKVCYANPGHRTSAAASTQLAIAYYMNNRMVSAMEAEVNALSQANDSINIYVDLRAQLAGSLVGSGRIKDATRLIQSLNSFVSDSDDTNSVARSLAIANNNIANELLTVKRSLESNALMIECARAARNFWKKCGTWINEERALYLLALVYNRIGSYDKALKHANHALRVIYANGKEDVDEAFIHLAVATATFGHSRDATESASMVTKADALVAMWSDNSMLEEFQKARDEALAKLPRSQ